VLSWAKEEGFTPGLVCALHTFGGVLNFHPHIHMLLTAGGLDEEAETWHRCTYFPHDVLKSRFRAILVRMLRAWVKEQTLSVPKSLVALWKKKLSVSTFAGMLRGLFSYTWYVHIGERLKNASYTVRYIGRYVKRPCISEAKIVSYDGETVVFEYKDKLTKEHTRTALSAHEFIGRLIRHIPEKGFRMVRHYGVYANRTDTKDMLAHAVTACYGAYTLRAYTLTSWRERVKRTTGEDPLICPWCEKEMTLVERAYRARDGPGLVVKTY